MISYRALRDPDQATRMDYRRTEENKQLQWLKETLKHDE